MKTQSFFLAGALLFCLVINSCEWSAVAADGKYFDYELRGTWVTNGGGNEYSGGLEITYDAITISGYGTNQGRYKPDTDRPFHGFTKEIPLEGYSKEGRLFIFDDGIWKESIPYTYFTPGAYEILVFNFGGTAEKLQKQ